MQTNQSNQQNQPQTPKPNNQLQVVSNTINSLEPRFNQLLSEHTAKLKFTQEAHFAMQAMQKNDFLMTTAIRNQASLMNAVLNVASIGLSLNPAERQAYLVPREGQVCLDIGYIGFADLATQSGAIKWVKANLVYEKDTYEFRGMGKEPLHNYARFSKDRGPVVGVYCVALTYDGQYLVEEMTIEECHAIRNRTMQWKKNQGGPWKTDEGEMMKKTVIKRAAKLWPKAPKDTRLFKAIEVVNQHEGIDFEAEREEENKAKEALRLAAREKFEADREEKRKLVDVTIRDLSTELTTGMTAQDKVKFMREVLGVQSYDHLNSHSIDELRALSEKLSALKAPIETNEGNETNGTEVIDSSPVDQQ